MKPQKKYNLNLIKLMKIAIIAHDGTKDRLRGFLKSKIDLIKNHTMVVLKTLKLSNN